MEKTSHVPKPVHSVTSEKNKSGGEFARSGRQRDQFLNMALNMSWQLAIVVLVPILAGVKLDKVFGTGSVYTFVGLGLALIGSIAVMWRTMQVANRLPVPKLTASQKRAIKKSYEEEDKDE
ncbi:MAG TPA: AtpZ/AtpI family protein [Candidatus Saccharimonadales bacterium]|jgi:F0F1-type ATP synthase assembly protein I